MFVRALSLCANKAQTWMKKPTDTHEGASHKTITPWNINDYPINLTLNELSNSHADSYSYRISYSKEATLLMLKEMDYFVIYGSVVCVGAEIVSCAAPENSIYLSENKPSEAEKKNIFRTS